MTWAAASIWIVGKIGTAVGWGYIDIAIILAAANLAVFKFRAPLQNVQLRGHQSELRRLAHTAGTQEHLAAGTLIQRTRRIDARPAGSLL